MVGKFRVALKETCFEYSGTFLSDALGQGKTFFGPLNINGFELVVRNGDQFKKSCKQLIKT